MITAQDFLKETIVFFGSAEKKLEYVEADAKTCFCLYGNNANQIDVKRLARTPEEVGAIRKHVDSYMARMGGLIIEATLLSDNEAIMTFRFKKIDYVPPECLLKVRFAIKKEILSFEDDFQIEINNTDQIIFPLSKYDGETLVEYDKYLSNYSPDLQRLVLYTLKYPPLENTLETITKRTTAIESKLGLINNQMTETTAKIEQNEANILGLQKTNPIIYVLLGLILLNTGLLGILGVYNVLGYLNPPTHSSQQQSQSTADAPPTEKPVSDLQQTSEPVAGSQSAEQTAVAPQNTSHTASSPQPPEPIKPEATDSQTSEQNSDAEQQSIATISLAENTQLASVTIELDNIDSIKNQRYQLLSKEVPLSLPLSQRSTLSNIQSEISKIQYQMPISEQGTLIAEGMAIELLAVSIRSDLPTGKDKVFVNGQEQGPTGVFLIVQQDKPYKIRVIGNGGDVSEEYNFTEDTTITACLKGTKQELRDNAGHNKRDGCG